MSINHVPTHEKIDIDQFIKASIVKKSKNSPSLPTHNLQNPQVQPPQTKAPLPKMPIRRLEIRTPTFDGGVNVPAPAALVGD